MKSSTVKKLSIVAGNMMGGLQTRIDMHKLQLRRKSEPGSFRNYLFNTLVCFM
jgi:hypothetical protein